ncbi:MAG TPA: hypothetical protein VKJ01_12680 [Candidatus Solibacter sp.]|nr:hypothetical protein [Candidatus Solibacter sp.]
MREPRLGDDIDDFCVRCKRVMTHNIVSVIQGEPAKVRCRTCHSDHDFRHEQAPPPKVDLRKQALFNEVLKTVSPDAAAADAEADSEADLEIAADAEIEMEAAAAAESEVAEVVEAVEVKEAPKPKKAKARPRK